MRSREVNQCHTLQIRLRFLVHAKNQCIFPRVQVQTDDRRLLGLKFGIRAFATPVMNLVRLQRCLVRGAMDCGRPETGNPGELSGTPRVGAVNRARSQANLMTCALCHGVMLEGRSLRCLSERPSSRSCKKRFRHFRQLVSLNSLPELISFNVRPSADNRIT